MNGQDSPARRWKGTGDASLDMVLAAAGFQPGDLARAHQRRLDALDAVLPNGKPDHPSRLSAARDIFGMVGLHPSRKIDHDGGPVNVDVRIVVGDPLREPEADRRPVRIVSGERNGA